MLPSWADKFWYFAMNKNPRQDIVFKDIVSVLTLQKYRK